MDQRLPSAAETPSNAETLRMIHGKIIDWLREEANEQITEVDYDAPLFELGIDSLGAASIAAELETASNKTLDPEVVFEMETIRELAEYLDSLPAMPAVFDRAAALGESPRRFSPAASEPDATTVSEIANACGAGNESGTVTAGRVAGESAGDFEPAGSGGDKLRHYARLNRRINSLKEQGLYFFEPEISEHDGSWVTANGQRMLMLGSYEYLGLLEHPHLKQTAIEAIRKFGTGHHGVRLLAGTTTVHRALEAKLAALMRAQDAIVYSSGFVTNLATISALVGRGDCVIGDQWNHASIADGCRMSGAEFLEFRHNDMDSLAEQLRAAGGRRTLVVVDSVFSMDGDIIQLPKVVELCKRYNALLMVDEAHSLGVLGKTGRGIQEHFDLPADAIDVKMGTLSKSLAGCGGFVAGDEEITTYLRHHARGYIFSGALPAGQASVAIAALEVLEREPQRVANLWKNVDYYLQGLKNLGFDTASSVTPIVPVMTRNEALTLEMTRRCRAAGLLVIPVAYPAVPADAPRLRTCVSAIHSREDLDFALEVLGRAGRETGLIE